MATCMLEKLVSLAVASVAEASYLGGVADNFHPPSVSSVFICRRLFSIVFKSYYPVQFELQL